MAKKKPSRGTYNPKAGGGGNNAGRPEGGGAGAGKKNTGGGGGGGNQGGGSFGFEAEMKEAAEAAEAAGRPHPQAADLLLHPQKHQAADQKEGEANAQLLHLFLLEVS